MMKIIDPITVILALMLEIIKTYMPCKLALQFEVWNVILLYDTILSHNF